MITYWLKRGLRKFKFLKHSFFKNIQLLSQQTFFKRYLSDYILVENFTCSNSIIIVEGLIRWKRGFEMFFIDHYVGDIGNKNIAVM